MADFWNSKKDTSLEKPAVNTTIVGGRPPGSGREIDAIPRGIEILIKKAAIDPEFKKILLKDRSQAANHINLNLEPSETAMLNIIPQRHLEGIISATKVTPNIRQAFLSCSAAVMLAALTVTSEAKVDNIVVSGGLEVKGVYLDDLDWAQSPFFKKADIDAKLETGTLKIVISYESNKQPVHEAKVRFKKIEPDTDTAGAGLTDEKGVYRLEGVPVGKYSVKVSHPNYGFFVSSQIEIRAKKDNLETIALPAVVTFTVTRSAGISRSVGPFFTKSDEDARLEAGILKVIVTDKITNQPLPKVTVQFTKFKMDKEKTEKNYTGTRGMGWTDEKGVYCIEKVPVGKFEINISINEYYSQELEIDITASKKNTINIGLDKKNAATDGIRPK